MLDLIPMYTESFIKNNGLKKLKSFFKKTCVKNYAWKYYIHYYSYTFLKVAKTSFLSLCSLVSVHEIWLLRKSYFFGLQFNVSGEFDRKYSQKAVIWDRTVGVCPTAQMKMKIKSK